MFLKLVGALLYSASLAFSAENDTVALPQDIVLVAPNSTVPLGAKACVGWETPSDFKGYVGIGTDYQFFLVGPNNDVIAQITDLANMTGSLPRVPHECESPINVASTCPIVSDPGTYIISLNITYNMSSDISQVNSSSCGPGPFSTQTFRFNTSFEASDTNAGPNVTISGAKTTVTFPTAPTGLVKTKLDGSSASSAKGVMQPAACLFTAICGVWGVAVLFW
ncbi:hypothetical protein PUNSTDRAFT_134690 [Punctularia strigosozonata HHB-11173 SS5]|uniref:uncharacterized protein n=1 Tax=Punctularia strigosozonata (strain HHB-11173) TaxID=741275 RepID=UPI0004417FDC|nr:uncharacterized protein PUNSTDRAFT_134690 [Punctularia strigosozonata HHB-11173 SS5]EIN08298.1 hypothetical protein PUNSTDRAFT_134690 [Punctularia strigosozonata HHB-11173 SS5]